jgi:O-antigen ligase
VLFYSYSRSAVVGVTLALASFGWLLMKRPSVKWLVSGALILLIISGFYIGFRSNQTIQKVFLHTSNTSTSSASSNRVRDVAVHNAILDVRAQPWGRGPGTAGPASFRNFGHTARIAEDYYLQIGQEVGVLGIALFLAINILAAKELWSRRQNVLAQILLASLIGISFVNLVSHAWADDTLSLLWWGLAGIACAPAILKPRKKDGPLRLQKT